MLGVCFRVSVNKDELCIRQVTWDTERLDGKGESEGWKKRGGMEDLTYYRVDEMKTGAGGSAKCREGNDMQIRRGREGGRRKLGQGGICLAKITQKE